MFYVVRFRLSNVSLHYNIPVGNMDETKVPRSTLKGNFKFHHKVTLLVKAMNGLSVDVII